MSLFLIRTDTRVVGDADSTEDTLDAPVVRLFARHSTSSPLIDYFRLEMTSMSKFEDVRVSILSWHSQEAGSEEMLLLYQFSVD